MQRCARCNGALFIEAGEQRCLSCGRSPGPQRQAPSASEYQASETAEKAMTLAIAGRARSQKAV